jgi:hypothetical protein
MKTGLFLSAAVGALLLSTPTAFGETYTTTTTTTYSASAYNPRAVPLNPYAITNNTLITGPGVGLMNPDQWGRANAVYVEHEIEKAQADGRDVSIADAQFGLAMNELDHGLNKEAAQHFDNALRAVGVEPNTPDQNAGEPIRPHFSMPGETKP